MLSFSTLRSLKVFREVLLIFSCTMVSLLWRIHLHISSHHMSTYLFTAINSPVHNECLYYVCIAFLKSLCSSPHVIFLPTPGSVPSSQRNGPGHLHKCIQRRPGLSWCIYSPDNSLSYGLSTFHIYKYIYLMEKISLPSARNSFQTQSSLCTQFVCQWKSIH
jgi:hypothetical protein